MLKSEYAYRRYTTQDGLPNLLLETAFQDSRGFLWIGTYKGFARFDGLKYTSFLAETATNILKLENGENGDVRAYTYHDVFMIDRNDSVRTINFTPQEIYLNTYNSRDLPNDYLILENENATEKYLVHFENDTIKELLRCAELNEIVGSKPFLDLKASKIYLPSLSGLNIFDLNTNKSVKIKGLTAECFLQHSELGLLAFDNDGIYQIVENIAKKLVSCRMSNDKRAAEISDGSIVVKDQKAIYRFRESNFELINQFNLSVVDLIRDNEGNVWVATHDGFYNFFHFDFINLQLEKDVVKFVQEDAHNNLWYGTIYGNLLHETDGKVSKILFPRQELKSFLFGSASVGKTLYFPRDNDILMYENSHFSWANLPYNIEDYDGYTKVLPYDKDKILILRGIGVYLCQKNGKIIHFYSDEELKQTDFQDIAIDSQGRWFACGHLGISAVNGDSVELFGNDNTAHTTSLCIDNQDNVWSASGNMLNLLHDDSITTVWQFPDDPVQAIYSVEKDYLLISTIHCVYFFNKTAFLQSGLCQFILFNQNNGFMGLNPQINGIFADSKGHFYLSCANMLVQFEPQNLLRKPLAPILNILSVKVSTDNIKWQNADLQSNIKLNHKNKNIKFSFIGLHFSAAENVRYHYRLIGFQNSWSEPTKQREVTFNNLPPGDYTFEIYADAGTDDSRSETVAY
ncbi:MAG: hypothetical protein LBR66_04660, partial [Candidatus Symbiothrix sp.]|nr:hypothetical protein [Candidatus Symbiothrix sp.]